MANFERVIIQDELPGNIFDATERYYASLLGYKTVSKGMYSSFSVLGVVNLINKLLLPALLFVPLLLLPPNICCLITALVVL